MIVQYIPRRNIFTAIKYGLLYNWYAAVRPQTVEYGYLYNFYAATDARNIAASGWHVCSDTELTTLNNYIGAPAGEEIRETGSTYWTAGNTGTNTVGFSLRGGGRRTSTGSFVDLKSTAYIWTSLDAGTNAFYLYIVYNNDSFPFNALSKKMGASVRLIKDSTTLSHGQTGTYTGNDGRMYATICIGTQEWISENLMETKYRNGDAIPEVTDNTAWAALTTGARCAYNNTITNVGLGNAITSSDDWVVPTLAELVTLREYLGGASVAGGKLKETGLSYWITPNTGATNESGFNGRGCGYRNSSDGSFNSINTYAWLISTTEVTSTQYGQAQLWSSSGAFQFGAYINKRTGSCIRLLYTGAGTPTSYTGNDGKKYRVVTIGTQTWLADNLAETKYRDGSYITGYDGGVYTPIADLTWAGLSTGALCAYDDDTNNI